MLSLTKGFEDRVKLSDGKTYKLRLDFQTVLTWYEMLEDEDLTEYDKVINAFSLFVGDVPVSVDEKARLVNYIAQIITERPYGNNKVLEDTKHNVNHKYFSYTKDAEAIYASFLYDYNIDLLECPGMRWEKFQALFNNLSEDSPLMRIVRIRQTDTSNMEGEQLERIMELQTYYMLDKKDTAENVEQDMSNVFGMLKANSVRKGG